MAKYICIKQVEAEEMGELEAETLGLLRDSIGDRTPREGYKVTYKDGYISWSPKDVFDNGYVLKEEKDK